MSIWSKRPTNQWVYFEWIVYKQQRHQSAHHHTPVLDMILLLISTKWYVIIFSERLHQLNPSPSRILHHSNLPVWPPLTHANTLDLMLAFFCWQRTIFHYFILKNLLVWAIFGRNFSDCTEISAKKLLDLASGKQNLNMGKKLSK